MTPKSPFIGGADTPATALRLLASRAHRVLRQGRAGDRDELLALLDEISRSRRLLDRASEGELADWFDRLEAQVADLLELTDSPDPHQPAAESSSAFGVGVA